MMTDQELIQTIQNGNLGAFEQLIARYQQPLFAFVQSLIKNTADAEEIVQDVFFITYRTIARIDLQKNFRAYLFVMARNQTISYIRRRRLTIDLESIAELPIPTELADDAIATEESLQIRTALEQLSNIQQQTIDLYYFQDFSYQEISQQLAIPINTVRTHLYRGKSALRLLLSYAGN